MAERRLKGTDGNIRFTSNCRPPSYNADPACRSHDDQKHENGIKTAGKAAFGPLQARGTFAAYA